MQWKPLRAEWDAVDLTTPDGIRIEVKSAAYIQSWHQVRESTISFRVRSPARDRQRRISSNQSPSDWPMCTCSPCCMNRPRPIQSMFGIGRSMSSPPVCSMPARVASVRSPSRHAKVHIFDRRTMAEPCQLQESREAAILARDVFALQEQRKASFAIERDDIGQASVFDPAAHSPRRGIAAAGTPVGAISVPAPAASRSPTASFGSARGSASRAATHRRGPRPCA